MDEITDLLSDYRIYFVLVKGKRIDEVVESNIALFTFSDILCQLIHSKIRNYGSGSSARQTVMLELSVEAGDAVLGIELINCVEQFIIEISADIK